MGKEVPSDARKKRLVLQLRDNPIILEGKRQETKVQREES